MTILQCDEKQYVVLTWDIAEDYTCAVCTDCATGEILSLAWPDLRKAKVIEHNGYKVGTPLSTSAKGKERFFTDVKLNKEFG